MLGAALNTRIWTEIKDKNFTVKVKSTSVSFTYTGETENVTAVWCSNSDCRANQKTEHKRTAQERSGNPPRRLLVGLRLKPGVLQRAELSRLLRCSTLASIQSSPLNSVGKTFGFPLVWNLHTSNHVRQQQNPFLWSNLLQENLLIYTKGADWWSVCPFCSWKPL